MTPPNPLHQRHQPSPTSAGTDSPADAPSSTDQTPLETTPFESRAATPDIDVGGPSSSAPSSSAGQHPLAVAHAPPQTEDELAAFRKEWEDEVRRRRADAAAPPQKLGGRRDEVQRAQQEARTEDKGRHDDEDQARDDAEASDDDDDDDVGRPHSPTRVSGLVGDHLIGKGKASAPTAQPKLAVSSATAPKQPSKGTEGSKAQVHNAVEAYAHAVQCERKGELDEALKFYRRAFRINQNADGLYQRAHALLDQGVTTTGSTAPDRSTLSANDAILAAPELASKVRAAIDFEDVRRAEVLQHEERTRALAATKGKGKKGDGEGAREGEAAPTTSPKAKRKSIELGTAPPPQTQVNVTSTGGSIDTLSALFERASLSGGVGEEKRDLASVSFLPEDEEKPVHIAVLPEEVLLHVLHCLAAPSGRRGAKISKPKADPNAAANAAEARAKAAASAAAAESKEGSNDASAEQQSSAVTTTTTTNRKPAHGIGVVIADPDWKSVEQLGRTCWKWRVLTKHSGLWQMIVRETYWPPQIAPDIPLKDLALAHGGDWRTTFVNQPRVRLNGVYIAACHYARPGMHEENIWVRVVHVVEFFRTIRFLPDGRALSLLTTEKPAETVRKMEPTLKSKGFAVGRWSLHPSGLPDDEWEGREPGAKILIEDLRDRTLEKYAFRMVFALKQTKRGKMDKLVMLDYQSINLHTAEVLPLPQKHARPFHFSVVRSY